MKHLFFDMDGTICNSRQVIEDEMGEKLRELMDAGYTITVISGAEEERMIEQLNHLPVTLLPQSGAISPFWKTEFTDEDRLEVLAHLMKIKLQYPLYFKDEKDLLQDRGSQMTFSFIGHNADIKDKKSFDPDRRVRLEVLKSVPFVSNRLECRIAGTTCFDYTNKESTKGKNIARYIKELGWDPDRCVYYGDALFKGGNDETVIGVIGVIEVTDPYDLLEKLNKVV